MCCHTMYLGKKFFFHIISKKKALLEKHHFYLSDMRLKGHLCNLGIQWW